jgi:hypothetical protein
MKEVAAMLLVALLLQGCSSNTTPVQTSAGGTWQAKMLGGNGEASGFSFITQFTVQGDGALSITSFQFLTHDNSSCFPVTGGTVTGTMSLTVNSNDTVTGTLLFTVLSGENTLTLNGVVTGTAVNNVTTLSGASITGNWTLAGDGTNGCGAAGGSFTMTQS